MRSNMDKKRIKKRKVTTSIGKKIVSLNKREKRKGELFCDFFILRDNTSK
jgi:hypothetical protein